LKRNTDDGEEPLLNKDKVEVNNKNQIDIRLPELKYSDADDCFNVQTQLHKTF
jgi:hypothetical protein